MKIIIISDTKVTEHAHEKALYIKEFRETCDTEVWDCSGWYKGGDGKASLNCLEIHSEKEFIENLNRVCKTSEKVFAIHAMIMDSYIKIAKGLKDYGVISVCIDNESYGRWTRYEYFYKYRKEMEIKARIKYEIQHVHFFRRLYFFVKYRGIKFDYSFGRYNYIPELNNGFIEGHNSNYEEIKKASLLSPIITGKYALFIDTAFATHPGFLRFKDKPDSNEYFKQMRKYFDEFERKNSMNIIIAAYPKVRLNKESFGNRKIYYDCTPQLIKNASAVLLHSSSTMMIAVALKKPVIFLYCEEWKNSCAKSFYYISKYYSELLGASWEDIEAPVESYSWDINEEKYETFIKAVIVNETMTDKSNFQLLFEAIQNIGCQSKGSKDGKK